MDAIQFNGNSNAQKIEKFIGKELDYELESETAYVAGVAPFNECSLNEYSPINFKTEDDVKNFLIDIGIKVL